MKCSFCLRKTAAWMHDTRAACTRCSDLIMNADYPQLAVIAAAAKLQVEGIPLQGPEEEGYRIALGLGFKAQMVLWAEKRTSLLLVEQDILRVNARRFALIEKEMEGELTDEETAELEKLQTEIDGLVDSVAPLPRLDLVAHIREQIDADPEAYANAAKLRCCEEKISQDLTGRLEDATLPPRQPTEEADYGGQD